MVVKAVRCYDLGDFERVQKSKDVAGGTYVAFLA